MNQIEQILKDKYSNIKFELYFNEKNHTIYLTGFIVPVNLRNSGIGSNFMKDLVGLADQYKYKIKLTPSNSYGGNVKRLFDFYQRFGFVRNKGKNKDFTHMEAMYRNPIAESDDTNDTTSSVKSWESGVTRGKANPISNTGKWESGVTRGKANPVSNTGKWESGVTRGKANPLNENDISLIYQHQTIYGWLTSDDNFIQVQFGGHEFVANKFFKDVIGDNDADATNTAIRNGWVRISKHDNYIYLDLYEENQIKPLLNTVFKPFVKYLLNNQDITFTIYILKNGKSIIISEYGIQVNGHDSRITLDKYLKSNLVLNEDMNNDDWFEFHLNETREIFQMIANKQKIVFDLIPKNLYYRAIQEFIKYGEFVRFPESKILEWKDIILENIAKLEILTSIAGHTQDFPYDEFYDVFDYNHETDEENDGEFSQWCQMKYKETGNDDFIKKYNFYSAYQFLDDVKNMDNYLPLFSNGQWLLSDFGLKPLFKIGNEMTYTSSPTELIVLINKALDITHQRSDLAEIFIEGGSKSLNFISNNQFNEVISKKNLLKIIKENLF